MTLCVFCYKHTGNHPQARLSPGEQCEECAATWEEERAETERDQSRTLDQYQVTERDA